MAGLQCHLRLYKQCFERDDETPPDPAQKSRFDMGTRVGVVARQVRPGGILIDEPFNKHEAAAAQTKQLLEHSDASTLYEAAFTEDAVRVRVDILSRSNDESWDLIEVKSSTSVKEEHIPDLAIQLHTLERSGLAIDRASIAHINRDYVYPGGAYDAFDLFAVSDRTTETRGWLGQVHGALADMRQSLESESAPIIDIGSHCTKPYACEFIEHCRRNEPEWSVDELPRITADRVSNFRASGIRSIFDIPSGSRLSETQERVREAVLTGEPFVSPALNEELHRILPPAHFIDFETANPALPIYPNTRPYEVLPFQWSDHVLHPDGQYSHHEFLAEGWDEPRPEFARTLTKQLAGAATIVTYSGYEITQLRNLARSLSRLPLGFDGLLSLPHVDLLSLVRSHYYHRDFRGSFSIKSVLPALIPDFGYADLEIQDGEVASSAFLEAIDEETPREISDSIRSDLLAYCRRDTEAMTRVVDALKSVN